MILVSLIGSLLLIGLVILCSKYVVPKCCCKGFGKVLAFIRDKLMFNSVFRALLQSYLLTSISVAATLRNPSFENSLGTTDFFLSLSLLFLCLILPQITHRLLHKNKDKLPTKEFKAKYESVYQNVDYYNPKALHNTTLFLGRRLIFAFFVIVWLDFSIVFQVLVADVLSTVLLAYYLQVFPMINRLNNMVQICNEIFVLVSVWLMFIFSQYVDEPKKRYDLAWGWLYLIAADIAINILVMFYVIGKKIYIGVRQYFVKRKAKKAMQVRVKNREEQMAKKAQTLAHNGHGSDSDES